MVDDGVDDDDNNDDGSRSSFFLFAFNRRGLAVPAPPRRRSR